MTKTKTVLVTGAGSGFGKGASIALAARGHNVIASTETDAQAVALSAEAPELVVERIDITGSDIDKVTEWDIDVLINNAGMGQTGPMADVPMDRVRKIFEVNVFGTLAITQRVLAGMIAKGAGRVIVMSSVGGLDSFPTFGPYCMSKHALEGMGKAMRAELAPQGIDVCMINPGPHNTGFNDAMAETMWEWFDDNSLQAPNKAMFTAVREAATTDQMDPMVVVDKLVELTEAEVTSEHNIVPPEGGVDELTEVSGQSD
ncbi:MAG: short-chain dehydrogenase [Gammaproteobacteria bacterium]|nr:short-chain dehydrogenase [Gammaproteobacteria bacterium]